MSERLFPERKPTEERLEKKWLTSPVLLASSSTFRAETLRRIGFQNVESQPMPDAAETAYMDEVGGADLSYDLSLHGAFLEWFTDGMSLPTATAKAKVEYLVNHGAEPNTFLIAADTLPRTAKLRFAEDGFCDGATIQYHRKPESTELLKIEFTKILQSIAEAMNFMKAKVNTQVIEQEGSSRETHNKLIGLAKLVAYAQHIEVMTGMAFRFPNETEIVTCLSHMCINPGIIRKIVLGETNKTVEDVVTEVFDHMVKKNPEAGKKARFIPYHDPEIIRILEGEEVGHGTLERGTYQGMPEQTLRNFLRDRSCDITRKI